MKNVASKILFAAMLLSLSLFLNAQDNVPDTAQKNPPAQAAPEPPNLWVTPKTPPPIEPGKGLTVKCPDPLPMWPKQWVKLDNTQESFYIYLPKGFNPQETYGVMVFIIGQREAYESEAAWLPVFDERKLIYIAPQRVGNKQIVGRRVSMALAAANLIKKYYKIDPKRVYIGGHSGGARMAGVAALNYPDLFRGTIQGCGADFYEPVPRVAAPEGGDYGGCAPGRTGEAKKNVRFVFVSGPGDFRYPFIVDIFNGGYKAQGFETLMIDVPTMKHEPYSAESLTKALDFIEGGFK